MYKRPAEWDSGKTIWLAWPFDENLWDKDLKACQQEFLALVFALHREKLVILCPSTEELALIQTRINARPGLSFQVCPYADIWLRDTLPIAVQDQNGSNAAVVPRFNGWGNKYLFDDDRDLNKRVAQLWKIPPLTTDVVFEGGAIECDGQGCLLTTEQCLLNNNRNPTKDKAAIEQEFLRLFGARKVIWLREGLKNDHTDGHVDTIARFVAPHTIAIMVPNSKDDPNYDVLMAIKEQLLHESDAFKTQFKLLELPSPGAVTNSEGKLLPASFLNFIMGDHTVVVPTYGTPFDEEAVAIFAHALKRDVIGLSAKAILSGGGAFHCISQENF